MNKKFLRHMLLVIVLVLNLFVPSLTSVMAESVVDPVESVEEMITDSTAEVVEAVIPEDETVEPIVEEEEVVDSSSVIESESVSESEEVDETEEVTPMQVVEGPLQTVITLTNNSGGDLGQINQYTNIQVNVDFTVPDGAFQAGDVSVIQLPQEVNFVENQTFAVTDAQGNQVATATFDRDTKQVTMVYTDYVENRSNISGQLFFSVRVSYEQVEGLEVVPLYFTVDGVTVYAGEVSYEKYVDNIDQHLIKYGYVETSDPTTNYYVVRVNVTGEELSNVRLVDTFQEGLTLNPDSFEILQVEFYQADNGEIWTRNEVAVDIPYSAHEDGRGFTMDFGDISHGYLVRYSANMGYELENGEYLVNRAEMFADQITPQVFESYTLYQEAGGSARGYNYSLGVNKVNEDGEPLAGAVFDVVRLASGQVVGQLITDETGYAEIGGLLYTDYQIIEVGAPEGYELVADPIEIGRDEFDGDNYASVTVVNSEIPEELIEVTGQKTWDDGDDQDGLRPDVITVNLLADGEVVDSQEVTAEAGWAYRFTDLPQNSNGAAIEYSVSEDPVENYTTAIDGFDITNTYSPEVTEVSGQKTWDDGDDQDGLRPGVITVNLLADGEVVDSQEVTVESDWSYSFTDLPRNANGSAIECTISEEPVEGFNITNSYSPEVSGQKYWNDGDNRDGLRPETITVNLLANGEVVDSQEVTAESDWAYSFTDLPRNANGTVIEYTVSEEPVENYNTTVEGFDITNSYSPEVAEVSG